MFPIQRFGKLPDVSNCGLYLASPAASYITGTNVLVDGGAYLTQPNIAFMMPQFVDMW